MITTLKVQVRGVPTVYPDCDQSRKLAAMLRTKTLTAVALRDAKALGFSFSFSATGSPHPAFVNALAGIEDPASTLEMAREAIRKILRHIPADAGGASLSADVDLCKRAIAILSGKA